MIEPPSRGGRAWRGAVAGTALGAAALSFSAPLADPDLPQHLAVGEWIVRHGAWPVVEPFAWTRAGRPYYAYSWLAQVTYYGALALAGPLGLHLLQALVGAGAVLLGARLARGRGWSAGVAAALGALNYVAMASVANELRPEQLLFLLLPLAWMLAEQAGGSFRATPPGAASPAPTAATAGGAGGAGAMPPPLAARRRLAPLLGAHLLLGCVAANVHLFFPLTAAPLGLRLAGGRSEDRPRQLAALAALVAGWLISPYGLLWPAVFRLNFAPNVLLLRPPAIAEMEPGFEAAFDVAGAAVIAALLLAQPWVRPLPPERARGREALAEALAWGGGLVLFAFAYRLIAVWWLLSLPAVGARLRAAAAALEGRRRLRAGAVLALAGAMLVTVSPPWPWELRLEGGLSARTLPTPVAGDARPLVDWLLCRTDPGAGGRIFTAFDFGSYLTWRLPRYSVSIDGRTIFPDTIAREFAWSPAGRLSPHARTWRSADLAILPRSMAVNDALAVDPAWTRLALTGPPDGRRGSAASTALWARRSWRARWQRPRSASCMQNPIVPPSTPRTPR